MNVYLHKPVNYSDMQGPAPSGFHVPTKDEWGGLKTIMDGLGLTTGDNWRINLHMPFAGNRLYSDASRSNQGTYGYYWSSSPYTSFPERASIIFIHSASLLVDAGIRTFGYPVRCFKNSFELPTSSWTVINGTLGGAGIFWDTVNGLISITGDGATGYTIQDKNLGATTVYNNGDTLTQANMGNMYQWGNNYGFPSTGSVTTSSTQVNAQDYGPGNYYSSSTFITRSSSPYDWSSVQNDNLRGGVSGLGGENELKNAYIGDVWKPNANTLGYYPLTATTTVNDQSGNGNNMTNNNSVTFGTNAGVSCGSFAFSSSKYLSLNKALSTSNNPFTVSIWCYLIPISSSTSDALMLWGIGNNSSTNGIVLYVRNVNFQGTYYVQYGWWGTDVNSGVALTANTWHNLVFTYDGTTMRVYLDGNKSPISTKNQTLNLSNTRTLIGSSLNLSGGNKWNGYLSEAIFENKTWTAQEAQLYYNNTKSNYGL